MYWDPMWGILILADFRPMGYKLSGMSGLLGLPWGGCAVVIRLRRVSKGMCFIEL